MVDNKDEKYLDYYCCPSCRDLLHKAKDKKYFCKNEQCTNNFVYEEAET